MTVESSMFWDFWIWKHENIFACLPYIILSSKFQNLRIRIFKLENDENRFFVGLNFFCIMIFFDIFQKWRFLNVQKQQSSQIFGISKFHEFRTCGQSLEQKTRLQNLTFLTPNIFDKFLNFFHFFTIPWPFLQGFWNF